LNEFKPPNTLISCNLCGAEITSCCMLSPDFSLKTQFESAMEQMRKHFKDIHGLDKPSE
jgi:hypothetical protein